MSISRRTVMVAGMGLALAGCVRSSVAPPVNQQSRHRPWLDRDQQTADRSTASPQPSPPAGVSTHAQPVPGAIARQHWTRVAGPVSRDIHAMNGVNRITVHHEGHTQVEFADVSSTQQRLEAIRRTHTAQRGWADIGYHFIIDRAGRVWCGRDVRYQGAHAREQNEHNIGVMVLGNFGVQAPTRAQVASLEQVVRTLMSFYRVPVNRIYTHRELPQQRTACPGDQLQAHVGWLRRARLA
ncbi:MAG: N-acetylmuramoyl-L-alanine amidase [Phycisphaeraceae bacterium]|nr:N-acetylmuramoyl-L-alanine amidase [Phycisphaeraceae bacterium]